MLPPCASSETSSETEDKGPASGLPGHVGGHALWPLVHKEPKVWRGESNLGEEVELQM